MQPDTRGKLIQPSIAIRRSSPQGQLNSNDSTREEARVVWLISSSTTHWISLLLYRSFKLPSGHGQVVQQLNLKSTALKQPGICCIEITWEQYLLVWLPEEKKKKGNLIWSNMWKNILHLTDQTCHKINTKHYAKHGKILQLPLATPAGWKGRLLTWSYFITTYNSSEGCANILGSGIRIYFRQEMLYLSVI